MERSPAALAAPSGHRAFLPADTSKFGRSLSDKPSELKTPRYDEPERQQERHQSGMSCTAKR